MTLPPARPSLALLLALATLSCAGAPAGRSDAAASGDARPASPGAGPAPAEPAGPRPPRPEDVSDQRAWSDLVTLCSFGPRAHGTSGWRRAQELFRQRLAENGFVVEDQTFTYQGVRDSEPTTFVNVIGRLRPEDPVRVLIGSHYDTRHWADEDPDPRRRTEPIQGANDGGSGAAVLLELATVLGAHPPAHGVDLVFFDGEDYGPRGSPDYFLGSRDLASRWDADPTAVRPRFAIILDMVGDADLLFRREATAEQRVPWLNNAIWDAGYRLGLQRHLATDQRPVIDDHTALLQAGVPATLLLDFDYPPWHTTRDTIEACSAESLGVTARLVIATAFQDPLPDGPPPPR